MPPKNLILKSLENVFRNRIQYSTSTTLSEITKFPYIIKWCCWWCCKYVAISWWGSEHTTPNYGTLVEGIWENSRSRTVTLTFLPFFPETGHKNFMWEVLSLYLEEKSSLISKDKGTKRILKKGLAKFPSVLLQLPHTLWPIMFLQNFPLFIRPSIKILRSNCFFES